MDWLHGDATTLPALGVDAAFMTANVAQVFVTEADWMATLLGRGVAAPPRQLVFETRDPARRAWEQWTPSWPNGGVDCLASACQSWEEVIDVTDAGHVPVDDLFRRDDCPRIDVHVAVSRRAEMETSLRAQGTRNEVRDAPDRPGREFVFLAVFSH